MFPEVWEKQATIWPSALRELRAALRKIQENKPRRVGQSGAKVAGRLHTDASETGLGCVLDREGVPEIMARRFGKGEVKEPIGLKELRAIAEGIQWVAPRFVSKCIELYTDNTNCESWLRRSVGPSRKHIALLQKIQNLREKYNIEIRVKRVESRQNIADGPSRN